MAISFAAWFEIDSKYGEKANSIKTKKLEGVRKKIREVCKDTKGDIDEENIQKITELYDESKNPIESLNTTTQLFFISGTSFLLSVVVRIAVDYLSIQTIGGLEGISFSVGMFIFVISWINCYSLRTLLTSAKDPPIIKLLNALVAGLLEGINAYLLYQIMQIVLSGRAALDIIIFAGFLILSFPGAIIYIWKINERRWMLVGYALMLLPWIYLILIYVIEEILKYL